MLGAKDKEWIDRWIAVPSLSDARLSPDGTWVAYVMRTVDWERDRFIRSVRIVPTDGSDSVAAAPKWDRSWHPRWSPLGGRLLFAGIEALGDAPFLYSISWPSGGTPERLAPLPCGCHGLDWSPDASKVTCLAPPPLSDAVREARERYGEVSDSDASRPTDQLWIWTAGDRVFSMCPALPFHINHAVWSPDAQKLAMCISPSASAEAWDQATIALYDPCTASARTLPVGTGCGAPVWSPSGRSIAFYRRNQPTFLSNGALSLCDLTTGNLCLLSPFDEELRPIAWDEEGIYVMGLQRANGHIFRVQEDGRTGRVTPDRGNGFAIVEGWGGEGCTMNRDGTHLAAVAHWEDTPGEVALLDLKTQSVRALTSHRAAILPDLPTSERVQWSARDGVSIEGILHRSRGTGKCYGSPVVLVLHGGPTALSFHAPCVESDWKLSAIGLLVRRGAVVLRPNYRGSAGYGEAFRRANVRLLGRINLDDILSGVDELASRGWIDPKRVGVTGMSHGGYLAAFLATASDRVTAAVVQGGISDWAVNYGCNLQPDWERQYLGGTPWDESAVYQAASPLAYVSRASAPTLILHGEQDRQAPTANARMLYRALQDHGVPARLVVYPDTGHGPSRPRTLRHHMESTVAWFDRWLFDARVRP